jgi:phosphatidylglycerophosphatase A
MSRSGEEPGGAPGFKLRVQKLVGSVLGIGYVGKGGGTLAAAVCAVFIYGADLLTQGGRDPGELLRLVYLPLVTLILTVLGIWSGNGVEAIWGKDSSKVVMDEVVGMLVTVLFHPLGWKTILAGLFLFRIFDIGKPLGIRRTEKLPGGWGVMVDDILAGIYGSIVLCFLEYINWV